MPYQPASPDAIRTLLEPFSNLKLAAGWHPDTSARVNIHLPGLVLKSADVRDLTAEGFDVICLGQRCFSFSYEEVSRVDIINPAGYDVRHRFTPSDPQL